MLSRIDGCEVHVPGAATRDPRPAASQPRGWKVHDWKLGGSCCPSAVPGSKGFGQHLGGTGRIQGAPGDSVFGQGFPPLAGTCGRSLPKGARHVVSSIAAYTSSGTISKLQYERRMLYLDLKKSPVQNAVTYVCLGY